jgi:hypothetical protein
MRKLLLLLCVTLFDLGVLQARDNPFKPVIDNTVLPVTSNTVRETPPFQTLKIALPSDARVLTSVALYYQSIDGSIKKRVVAVDKAIDWHKPIVVTQEGLPAASEKVAASTKPPKKQVKKATAATSKKTKKSTRKLRFTPLPFVAIEVGHKQVHIVTKDEKIRAFHLTHPFKVAIDFRRKAGFLTRHISVEKPPFRAIDIGNHAGYYRVVITFDAPYRYTIKKSSDGYILRVR